MRSLTAWSMWRIVPGSGPDPSRVPVWGYDPEPFSTLADHGLLLDALLDETGELRRVHGERAGMWISDECALATPEEPSTRSDG